MIELFQGEKSENLLFLPQLNINNKLKNKALFNYHNFWFYKQSQMKPLFQIHSSWESQQGVFTLYRCHFLVGYYSSSNLDSKEYGLFNASLLLGQVGQRKSKNGLRLI
jgi:hypothetical protein